MPITPAIPSGSVLDPNGLAQQLADLRRQLAQLSAARTVIGAGSVNGANIIQPGTITSSHIAAGTIQASNIAAGAITAGLISAGAITAGAIAANSITSDHLQANSVIAGKIAAGAITSGTIAAGAITAGTIAAGAIQTNDLAALSITTAKIAAGAVDATKITVTTLSSLSSNMGSITAGTIQGATVQTAGSGSRVVMDSAGLRGYALDGVTKSFEINTGSGIASFVGVAQLDPTSIVPSGALPPMGGGNMFVNSGFEDPATPLASWPAGGGGTWTAVTAASNHNDVHDGARAVKLTPSANGTGANYRGQALGPGNVKPNTKYTISAWVRGTSANPRQLDFMISTEKASVPGTFNANIFPTGAKPLNGTWSRIKATFTAPADVREMIPYLHFTDNGDAGDIYLDSAQIEEGEVATAWSPKTTELLPGSVTDAMVSSFGVSKLTGFIGGGNLLTDASFESTDPATPGSNWTVTGVTISKSPAIAIHGVNSLAVNRSSGTDPYAYTQTTSATLSVLKGRPVVFSAWVWIPAATSGLVSGGVDRCLLISDGVGSGSVTITNLTRDAWNRVVLKFTVAAAATFMQVRLYNPFTSGVVYYDGVQLEIGDAPTAFQPRADEILYAQINTVHLAAGAVVANTVAAGAITAQKLSIKQEGANTLPNARFIYYTQVGGDPGVVQTDLPGYWQKYDNGGTGTKVYSKIASGGPNGENSVRIVATGINAPTGVMTQATQPFLANTTYIRSWWWKSAAQPDIAANAPLDVLNEWVDNPTPNASVWQRYSKRVRSSTGGPRNINGGTTPGPLGWDWYYVMGPQTGSWTAEIANPQWEQGEYPTPHATRADELLPYSVGNTVLTPDSVTTDKILAGTIQGGDIAATTITGTNIAAGTITAGHMSVSTLSAITADLGSVTAGTITGAVIRSAASGARVEVNTTGLELISSTGTTLAAIRPGGGIEMGPSAAGTTSGDRFYRFYNSTLGWRSCWGTFAGSDFSTTRFFTAAPAGTGSSRSMDIGVGVGNSPLVGDVGNECRMRWEMFDSFGQILVKAQRNDGTGGSGANYLLLGYADTSNWQFASSDGRLKTNIEAADEPVAGVLRALRPVRFNWKDKGDGSRQLGLIAQEVRKLIPEAVYETRISEDEDPTLNVDSRAMTAFLVQALQGIDARLSALEARTL